MCVCVLSRVQLFATPWTVAHQAPLSMEFSKQEYWSRLPFTLPQEDLPNPGIKPALTSRFITTELQAQAEFFGSSVGGRREFQTTKSSCC